MTGELQVSARLGKTLISRRDLLDYDARRRRHFHSEDASVAEEVSVWRLRGVRVTFACRRQGPPHRSRGLTSRRASARVRLRQMQTEYQCHWLGPTTFRLALSLAVLAVAPALADSGPPPYPPSNVWGPVVWHWETLQTAAPGSDLWPITWGRDDHLYSAWGDGGGFGGTDSRGRVAFGFARLEGRPENWLGFNVNGGWQPEHPSSFPGKHGKVSGLCSLGGVLYANVNLQDDTWPNVHHQLAWSTNTGASWQRADWRFPKGRGAFQPGKFLALGRDGSGVPKPLAGFAYLYGFRQPDTREEVRDAYLARVPVQRLREASAYAYFAGVGSAGLPRWESNFQLARPVLCDPHGLAGVTVVFEPGRQRFLASAFHAGPGQLGLFDAPTPWGPWTTILYSENWGGMGSAGEGLSCEFPAKWLRPQGDGGWCVFSVYGDGGKRGIQAHDRFNLVRVSFGPGKP